MCVCAQLCLTLCDPKDCSPPGSSVSGISQARILEWVAISFSKGSPWPRDWTQVSCGSYIGRRILYHWATWEAVQVYKQWKFKSTNESLWDEGNWLCDHDILSVILGISEQFIQEMTDANILSIMMSCMNTWWNPLIGSYPYYLHEKPTLSLFEGSCYGNIWNNPSSTTSTETDSRT